MTWTSKEHVESRWVGAGFPDGAAGTALVETLIGDAERLIVHEYPEIPTRVVGDPEFDEDAEKPLAVETVQMVVARVVIRHLRNPAGARQETETEGPFSRNRTFAGDRPGVLWLSDEERELLGYLPGAPSQKAFTVPQSTTAGGLLGGSDVFG